MKKIFLVSLAAIALATAAYSEMAVGLRVPFSILTQSCGDWGSSEMWVGGAGTFEYDFLPILGVEASVGYLMSLGGKYTYKGTTRSEYKNNIISIPILLKVYPPIMGEGKSIHFYFAGGPMIGVSIRTTSVKGADPAKPNDYAKTSSETDITLGGLPTFAAGVDYDITKAMKLGGALELLFSSSSYTPEGGKSYSSTGIDLGLGAGFKYCF